MTDAGTRDAITTWRSDVLNGALFLRADFKRQRFQPHFHAEYAIGVIDAGCQAFTYDGRHRLDMPQGAVAVIAPGIVHAGWPGAEQGWRYRMLYPDAATVRTAAEDVFGRPVRLAASLPVVDDVELAGRLSRLHDRSADPAAGGLEIESLFLAAVRVLFERHMSAPSIGTAPLNLPALQRVRHLIEDRYDARLRLVDLGALARMSKFSVVRQFKAAFGLPPHAYQKQVRVMRARDLILSGSPPLDVAFRAGFADQAHMTRAFRSILGFTPGVLARGR